jgi:outer membrane lipoprotein-sorting protein
MNCINTTKEKIMVGVILLLLGAIIALVVLLAYQYNDKLNAVSTRLNQLDAKVQTNTANTKQIVDFLNKQLEANNVNK